MRSYERFLAGKLHGHLSRRHVNRYARRLVHQTIRELRTYRSAHRKM